MLSWYPVREFTKVWSSFWPGESSAQFAKQFGKHYVDVVEVKLTIQCLVQVRNEISGSVTNLYNILENIESVYSRLNRHKFF